MARSTSSALAAALAVVTLLALSLQEQAAAQASATKRGNCADIPTVINTTNGYRAQHRADTLAWDPDLAGGSADYAKKLAAADCSLKHSAGRDYGENLYMMQGLGLTTTDYTCTPGVMSWYGEVVYYNFKAARPFYDNWYGSSYDVGHFTQVVWRGTKRQGCGVAVVETLVVAGTRSAVRSCKVVVCRYKPPGNWATDMDFLKNVLPNVTATIF